MKCDKIAHAILKYLAENRGVGNTRTVLDGATATKASIVLTREDAQRAYRNVKPAQLISLEDVEKGVLDTRKGWPLVLDNAALEVLLQGLVKKESKGK